MIGILRDIVFPLIIGIIVIILGFIILRGFVNATPIQESPDCPVVAPDPTPTPIFIPTCPDLVCPTLYVPCYGYAYEIGRLAIAKDYIGETLRDFPVAWKGSDYLDEALYHIDKVIEGMRLRMCDSE